MILYQRTADRTALYHTDTTVTYAAVDCVVAVAMIMMLVEIHNIIT